jgi:hypothetical protein
MNNFKIVFLIVAFLILSNLVILDYVVVTSNTHKATEISPASLEVTPQRINDSIPVASVSAGQPIFSAESFIEATTALTARIEALEKKGVTSSAPVIISSGTTKATAVKEYYIPLGSGSTNATDWVDLPGVESYVAPGNYGTIKSIYFEAALRIPTGNGTAYARLLNVTDNTSLFETEITYQGTTGNLISSGAFPVPYATKLYRVQLKSSLGAEVVLDSARIKIFTQ